MITDKLDRSFRDLRISVTDRCNFRCAYCMPAEIYGDSYKFLPRPDLLTFEEIVRITKIFVGLGAEKVRLTGGEPLVRRQIENLVREITQIPGLADIAMTTNGYMLSEKALLLKNSGLHRVTVSLDTLDEDVFMKMNGRNIGPKRILEGINAAERVGLVPIKINSVVQKGTNDEGIVRLARYFKDKGHTVRFIEYMDVGNLNGWQLEQVLSGKEIAEIIDAEMPLEPIPSEYRGEVASRYRYRDGSAEIGIITSVTKPFCGDCTRIRLSPEGKIFPCLFATAGTDLRGPIRAGFSDKEIRAIIERTWLVRDDRYSEKRASMTAPMQNKVEMYHIGG